MWQRTLLVYLVTAALAVKVGSVKNAVTPPEGGAGAGTGRKAKHHKKGHHQQHLSAPSLSGSYGLELPAFAYDYSEYVISAVIERSMDTSELHLTMFLVGHSVVFNDYPFETISTDEAVLYTWGQAAKVWDRNKNRTALTKYSGLMCVLKNNDPKHSQPYRVPALWVPTSLARDHKLHGSFEVLRCRLRGSQTIYSSLSKDGDKALFVDLVRARAAGGGGVGGGAGAAAVGRGGGGADGGAQRGNGRRKERAGGAGAGARRRLANTALNASTAATPPPHDDDVLLSFNVPWRRRTAGHGTSGTAALNASRFASWHGATRVAFVGAQGRNRSSALLSSSSSSQQQQQQQRGGGGGGTVVHMCVAGLRPLHPVRPNVGLPSLLEFLEHHSSLGVQHLFLGLLVSAQSPHMSRHKHLLRTFIDRGLVSILPSALPGFDDAAGFGGVHLNEAYAALLFNNQCLYLSKGVADYVVLLRANEFILPHPQPQAQAQAQAQGKLAALLQRLPPLSSAQQRAMPPSSSLAGTGAGTGTDGAGGEGACFYKLAGAFAVPDPPEMFGFLGGPGESAFSHLFFGNRSRPMGPLSAPHWQVAVLPTRLVLVTTSRDAAMCAIPASASGSGPGPGPGAGVRGKKGSGGEREARPILSRAVAMLIPPSDASVFSLGATLKRSDYTTSSSSSSSSSSLASAGPDAPLSLSLLFADVSTRLAAGGYPSAAAVQAAADEGAKRHQAAAQEAQRVLPFMTEEEKGHVPRVEVELASLALVPPFWQKCDVASLATVLGRALSS